jgi:hypothetical protein
VKRKLFALLAVAGVIGVAIQPASSMAGMAPASAKFEITSVGTIGTALGSCTLGKVTGQISSLGLGPNTVVVPPVTSCTTGTKITINGPEWGFRASTAPILVLAQLEREATVLRFASLPGCKLTGIMELKGIWSNATPGFKSTYHADSAAPLTWENDGASCALAGKKEVVTYSDLSGTEAKSPIVHQINNLTSPSTPISYTW